MIVFVFLYYIFISFKGVKAIQVLIITLLILLFNFLAETLNLTLFLSLIQIFKYMLIFYFVYNFQPEFRKILFNISNLPFFSNIIRKEVAEQEEYIKEIVDAVIEMSAKRIGALIVFEKNMDLSNYVDNEVIVDSKVTKELLISIFSLNTPLHDGAVIIKKNKIHSAKALLPLTESSNIPKEYGTRHRAALGITELTDAGVIVVSEETKIISYAQNGQFISTGVEKEELEDMLYDLLLQEKTKKIVKESVKSNEYENQKE